ncbi:hypothetical protein GUJ93_ZPchr0001g31499 [Zizania palustris]|uniref:Uncharacterized protein n=1 Tax=Zizania palustris TaxID=103762 RepID=A0A8J5VTL7_ZIZPA|nr:hypothetical protein GUJ93_ZPchr0001g31499 [Zizania palustris]
MGNNRGVNATSEPASSRCMATAPPDWGVRGRPGLGLEDHASLPFDVPPAASVPPPKLEGDKGSVGKGFFVFH